MDAKEYFIIAYSIYHTSNVVNEKKVDLKYIKEGYIFNKELLIDDVSKYLNPIGKLKTLFSKDDTLYEKLYKTFSEYVFGSIIANREIEHVTQLIKQIKVLDDKEMEEFCNNLVTSNKALTDDITVLKYISSFITVPFDEINNKEIKMLYMNKVIKEDVDKKINGKTLLMYMNYLLTGNTLFINTRKHNVVLIDIGKINMIKYVLNEYELELAKNYNTYKNTLLNIKMSNKEEFKTNINRITKLSKKVKQKNYTIKYNIDNLIELTDKPKRIDAGHNTDFLNRSLNENIMNFDLLDNINKLVDEKGIKYILKLIEVLERDLYFGSVEAKIYKIRNGKQHFDSEYKIKNKDKKIRLNNILKHYFKFNTPQEILDMINKNSLWDPSIEMSDKKMLSGVYFGSRIKILPNDTIGIDWEGDVDFDLSLVSEDGEITSWNNQWTSEDYTFSGDCTSAGSEYITLHNPMNAPNGYMSCCLYRNGDLDHKPKFRIFISRVENNETKIIFQSDYITPVNRNVSLGYIQNGYFILDVVAVDKKRVMGNTAISRIKMNQPTVYLAEILFEK